MWTPARRTAIVGIGATEFSKDSGRTPMQLATEACLAACGDAGLDPTLVDGMSLFSMERNYEIEVARNLGIPRLRFFSMVNHGGGGGCATVGMAAMAVHTGAADYVLAYRAFNERSWHRFGGGVQAHHQSPEANDVSFSWTSPFGLLTPAQWAGMFATRYMHQHGATSEDFGRIAVVDRRHAANNPAAFFHGRPITLEEHQASRIISDPLRLLDCCQESDGGVALLIASAERAEGLDREPAWIAAAAQGVAEDQWMMRSYYRDDITGIPEMGLVAEQLWKSSGLGPADMQAAMLYDHFTPLVLPQFEEFGFCAAGEAKDFIADGNIEVGGGLPINTNGGQLGEAYIHGMNGIAEGVRQVRGTSVNQVDGAVNVLVTSGSGVPTSGLVLSSEGG